MSYIKMEKRGIFSVLSMVLLLTLIPSAVSIFEELVFSDTVEDQDVVEIAGKTFKFRIDSQSNKVVVDIDTSGVIIASGECKIKGNFDICINDINFSYRDYEVYYDVYKAIVKVYQIKSKLDITNSIEKDSILIGEQTTVTLTMENTADTAAEGVTATIDIPSSLLITDVEGCKKILNSVVFEDNVFPGIRECKYKVQGLTADDFQLTANIGYFDGVNDINTTASVTGKVYNQSLKITYTSNKTKFDIGQKFDFIIDIENTNDQYDVRITTLSIKLPEKLLLTKKPIGTTGNNKIIGWSGTLAPQEKKSFVLSLQGLISGNYDIPVDTSYIVNKFLRKASESKTIEIKCDCPFIEHAFSQQIAVPDQRIGLNAVVKNPSQTLEFRNVKIDYITNVPNIQDYSTVYDKIRPLETIRIFNSPITTPALDEMYYFNITINYESFNNEIFIEKDNIIIAIPGSAEEEIEDTGQDEEDVEIQEQQEVEDVSAVTEETEESIEDSDKEEQPEEISVTTLEDEGQKSFKAFTIVIYIAILVFILIILLIFKRIKSKAKRDAIEEKEFKKPLKEHEKHPIKELFSFMRRKREGTERKVEYTGEDAADYESLKKQIEKLKISPDAKQGRQSSTRRFSKK